MVVLRAVAFSGGLLPWAEPSVSPKTAAAAAAGSAEAAAACCAASAAATCAAPVIPDAAPSMWARLLAASAAQARLAWLLGHAGSSCHMLAATARPVAAAADQLGSGSSKTAGMSTGWVVCALDGADLQPDAGSGHIGLASPHALTSEEYRTPARPCQPLRGEEPDGEQQQHCRPQCKCSSYLLHSWTWHMNLLHVCSFASPGMRLYATIT